MTEITIGAVCSCGWSHYERFTDRHMIEPIRRSVEAKAEYHRAAECPPIGTPPLEGEGKGWGGAHG